MNDSGEVAELKAELRQALRSMGYFVATHCATAHLAIRDCDCDERISAINKRLTSLGAFDCPKEETDDTPPDPAEND
ncbi:MAG: hypothetical protein WKF43_12605 [Acidimicrobiales bacterium]